MKDERIWIVRPGAFGKFVRIFIALSARAPSFSQPPTQRYWWCLISITNLRNKSQLAKFHGKKSLHRQRPQMTRSKLRVSEWRVESHSNYPELTEQREQKQACLHSAES